jgi:hypothetical protein
MTRNQFREMLTTHDLTQQACADLLGMHLISIARYARYGVDPPLSILFTLLLRQRITPSDIVQMRRYEREAAKRERPPGRRTGKARSARTGT